jgi:hypothetical protein
MKLAETSRILLALLVVVATLIAFSGWQFVGGGRCGKLKLKVGVREINSGWFGEWGGGHSEVGQQEEIMMRSVCQ